MTDKELVENIFKENYLNSLNEYKVIFDKYEEYIKNGIENRDNLYGPAMKLYSKLDTKDRAAIHKIINIIIADTLASFLGYLDGIRTEEDFHLTYGDSQENLTGYLCDLFLEMEEKYQLSRKKEGN